MLHAVFVLLFMMVGAPLASYIPLSALAGVLVVVAWNMAEKHEILALIRGSWSDGLVVVVTILLTVFQGLTEAIIVGFALSALLFIHRMSTATGVEQVVPPLADDGDDHGDRGSTSPIDPADPDVVIYRISGAFFFGAAGTVSSVLDRIADRHKALVLDFEAVSVIDSTAANSIARVVRKARRQGVSVFFSGASPEIRQALQSRGLVEPDVGFEPTAIEAVVKARRLPPGR